MALAHEHILTCAACHSPLVLTGLHPSAKTTTSTTRAVIGYQHTIADILAADDSCPATALSYLQPLREDHDDLSPTNLHDKAPATRTPTSLHALPMEGFDAPATRRAFAAHCALEPGVLEGHFATMSRLTGAGVGVCWCACHDAASDSCTLVPRGEEVDEGGAWAPSTPCPAEDTGGTKQTPHRGHHQGEDDGALMRETETVAKKRKRGSAVDAGKRPELKRPHRGAESEESE